MTADDDERLMIDDVDDGYDDADVGDVAMVVWR